MMFGFIATALSIGSLLHNHYRQNLEQHGLVVGKVLVRQLEHILDLGIPLWELSGFEQKCQEIVENYEDVTYAMVVSIHGTPLFSSLPDGMKAETIIAPNLSLIATGKELIAQTESGGEIYIDAMVPVQQPGGGKVGMVIIGIPLTVVNSKLEGMIEVTFLMALGSLLLMLLLMVPALNRLLFSPLQQLLEAIDHIRRDQQDFSRRVAVTGNNEMSELGNAFNELLRDLENSQKSIQEHTRTLERQVEERTIELQESLQSLNESNERFEGMARSSLDAIVMINDKGEVVFWNSAAEKITGYSSHDVIGLELHKLLVCPADMNDYKKGFSDFVVSGSGPYVGETLEVRTWRKNGEEFPAEVSVTAVRIKNRWYAVGTLRDITNRKQMEAELEHLAIHDALTGLYNRGELERRLNDEIQRAIRYQRPLSLFMLDIDWFKKINDSYGHMAGDEILRSLAELLMVEVRTQDYVSRYGGEEFVIILPETTPEEAVELAHRLCVEIADSRFCINGHKDLKVTVSIGVAGFPVHGDNLEGLLEAADMAMYAAKDAGRNQVVQAK
jgi:diguanylate cyclase (GGDEF)-like protein/PAS domain S-box-containing protein